MKAMYCQGSNPAVSYANNRVVMESLRGLEFIAVADFFLTPTAELADIVLPVATWMERSSVQTFFQVTYDDIHLQQKAVEISECRSDYRILNELAERLGFGEQMFRSEDELSDFILKPLGIRFEDLREMGRYVVPYRYRKYEQTGFGFPPFRHLHNSRKVELIPSKLRDLGFDPSPRHKEPLEGPVRSPGGDGEIPPDPDHRQKGSGLSAFGAAECRDPEEDRAGMSPSSIRKPQLLSGIQDGFLLGRDRRVPEGECRGKCPRHPRHRTGRRPYACTVA